MDKFEFLKSIDAVSKFIVNYRETVNAQNVMPNVPPGYLYAKAEDECPLKGGSFEEIFSEFKEKIMPGVTHWASPHFHAYFPAGNTYSCMVGELLTAGINNVGVNWEASPAITELETVVLNWLGKMMDLPKEFLNCSEGPGGGVFQNSSTEATLLSMTAARNKTIKKWQALCSDLTQAEITDKLIMYTSIQAHSSVERVGLMSNITTRFLPCDSQGKVTREILEKAVETDLSQNRIPFYYVAVMGATTTCSWDDLSELGQVCASNDLWMHVDAAYLGAALTCPELRYIANGLHHATSFAVGLHKWFLMSFDVVAYWMKDTSAISDVLHVDRTYLQHAHKIRKVDFSHLQIGNGRKFKALKVWMTLKSYGVQGVQDHIRRHVMLGQYFEKLMKEDGRFQVVMSGFGLVAFALKAGDEATESLRQEINDKKKLMLTPCHFNDRYLIRFVVNFSTKAEDVEFAWDIIRSTASLLENDAKKTEYVDSIIKTMDTFSTIRI